MRFAVRALAGALVMWCAVGAAAAPARSAGVTVDVQLDLTTERVRVQESSLANVIVDAVRAAARADVALIPASWFVECAVPKGPAAASAFLGALDLRTDVIVVARLTGDQLRRGVEHGLSLYPGKNPAFLQVSGMTVTIDGGAEPARRVLALRVGKAPVQDDRVYTVAMPSPLANGAQGYHRVWGKVTLDRALKATLEEATVDYLVAQKSVGAKSEERIVVRK